MVWDAPPAAPPPPGALLLALDTASPVVSVAAGSPPARPAVRSVEIAHSSARLLELVDAVLDEVGAAFDDVQGVVVLRGPGSFTGLRVGLSTALGFHQATGVRATALATLEVLAAAAGGVPGSRVAGCVDALRGEWFVQTFEIAHRPLPLEEARLLPRSHLPRLEAATLVGFGLDKLAAEEAWDGAPAPVVPGPLAPWALALVAQSGGTWDPTSLTRPLYLRAPQVTLPKGPRSRARG